MDHWSIGLSDPVPIRLNIMFLLKHPMKYAVRRANTKSIKY